MYAGVEERKETRVNGSDQASFPIVVEHAGAETMLTKAVGAVEEPSILWLPMRLLHANDVVSLAIFEKAQVTLGRLWYKRLRCELKRARVFHVTTEVAEAGMNACPCIV